MKDAAGAIIERDGQAIRLTVWFYSETRTRTLRRRGGRTSGRSGGALERWGMP
jgi:hypothetical protein